jgi:NTE family protein
MLAAVMAGGGSRGAYQAGVLRFVLGDLGPRLGPVVWPQIWSGTSAGALNSATVAAHNQHREGLERLLEIWRGVRIEQVYRFEATDLLRSPIRLFGARLPERPSLLDPAPLHLAVQKRIDWSAWRRTVAEGRVQALVVAATEASTGRCVLFVDRAPGAPKLQMRHSETMVVHTEIGAPHCIASSAIPFLFSPARVEGTLMVDGSLRQNTPLAPALRLGADRILVVGVRRSFEEEAAAARPAPGEGEELTLSFLAGKALNALMLDPVEKDLRHMELLNRLFERGEQVYGGAFLAQLNAGVVGQRGAAYRKVRSTIVRPRADLGQVAASVWRGGQVPCSRSTRVFLNGVAGGEAEDEADLLSYLLYDQAYTRILEELGFEDARAKEEELAALLTG